MSCALARHGRDPGHIHDYLDSLLGRFHLNMGRLLCTDFMGRLAHLCDGRAGLSRQQKQPSWHGGTRIGRSGSCGSRNRVRHAPCVTAVLQRRYYVESRRRFVANTLTLLALTPPVHLPCADFLRPPEEIRATTSAIFRMDIATPIRLLRSVPRLRAIAGPETVT